MINALLRLNRCTGLIQFRIFKSAIFLFFFVHLPLTFAIEIPTLDEENALAALATHRASNRTEGVVQLPNGFTALIVAGDSANTHIVLSVGSGIQNDPRDFPGLSHYLEHALFQGSKMFPDSYGLLNWTSHHGGMANATTELETTSFEVLLDNEYLSEALKRIADAMADPLFPADRIEKEKEVVHAEFLKQKGQNGWGTKDALRAFYSSDHPRSWEFTGNRETLAGVTPTLLRSFFEKFYLPSQMKMVVYLGDKSDFNSTKSLIREEFSKIPAREKPLEANAIPRFPKNVGPRLLQTEGKFGQNLSLIFSVPSTWESSLSLPHVLFPKILLASGKGSFRAYLMEQGWIRNLGVEHDLDLLDPSQEAEIRIEFELSKKGRVEWRSVVQAFFEFTKKAHLLGLPREYFEQVSQASIYRSSQNKELNVPSVARWMHRQTARQILQTGGALIPLRHSEASYRDFLSYLVPQRAQIVLESENPNWSQTSEKMTTQYGTHFQIQTLTPDEIEHGFSQNPLLNEALCPIGKYCSVEKVQNALNARAGLNAQRNKSPSWRILKKDKTCVVRKEKLKTNSEDHHLSSYEAIQFVLSSEHPSASNKSDAKLMNALLLKWIKEEFRHTLESPTEPTEGFSFSFDEQGRFVLQVETLNANLLERSKMVLSYFFSLLPDANMREEWAELVAEQKASIEAEPARTKATYLAASILTPGGIRGNSLDRMIENGLSLPLEGIRDYLNSFKNPTFMEVNGFGRIETPVLTELIDTFDQFAQSASPGEAKTKNMEESRDQKNDPSTETVLLPKKTSLLYFGHSEDPNPVLMQIYQMKNRGNRSEVNLEAATEFLNTLVFLKFRREGRAYIANVEVKSDPEKTVLAVLVQPKPGELEGVREELETLLSNAIAELRATKSNVLKESAFDHLEDTLGRRLANRKGRLRQIGCAISSIWHSFRITSTSVANALEDLLKIENQRKLTLVITPASIQTPITPRDGDRVIDDAFDVSSLFSRPL